MSDELPEIRDVLAGVAAGVADLAAACRRAVVWRVEIERHGCGVHLVADQAAAVQLADAAPGNAWVEPVGVVAEGEVLDAAAVNRLIAERRW